MVSRQNWICALLMAGAGVGSHALTPSVYTADRNRIDLTAMTPPTVGAWHEEVSPISLVESPEVGAELRRVYSQSLMRVYRNAEGVRVMLAVAYTSDQRGVSGHQVHMPEACYPAQGFKIIERMPGTLNVAGHDIPVVRMVARQGSRIEPLIYWMTLDGKPENSQVKLKLDQVRSSLMRGEVADGMIFRVSVIDADSARAYRIESDFLNDFFHGVGPRARRNFFGVST